MSPWYKTSGKWQKKALWYCIVSFAVTCSADVCQKLHQSRSLKGRHGPLKWVMDESLTGLREMKGKERQQLMEPRESNESAGEGWPTTMGFGREWSHLDLTSQGGTRGNQFLDFSLLVHFALPSRPSYWLTAHQNQSKEAGVMPFIQVSFLGTEQDGEE